MNTNKKNKRIDELKKVSGGNVSGSKVYAGNVTPYGPITVIVAKGQADYHIEYRKDESKRDSSL